MITDWVDEARDRVQKTAAYATKVTLPKKTEIPATVNRIGNQIGHEIGNEDIALLVTRLTAGGLLAGHGAQKLFGWFGGYGLQGTAGWLESMGLRPGNIWATAAGMSEFGGGLLTALGLFHPLGPIGVLAAMGMATFKAHWGKPIWVTQQGAELPVTNMAIVLSQAIGGPGRLSLDHALRIRVPRPVVFTAAALAATGVVIGVMAKPSPAPQSAEPEQEMTQTPDSQNLDTTSEPSTLSPEEPSWAIEELTIA